MGKTSASRRGKKDANNDSNKKTNDNDGNDETTPKSPLEELLQLDDYWIILKNHRTKIYWLLVLVGIPYALNLIWKKLILQHPQIILLLPLNMNIVRPSVVRRDDPRQVLILGSMMSYSDSDNNDNDMSKQFHNEFNGLIEIGYENSDTSWNFVRDGTQSWIHGIRYFDNNRDDENDNDFIRKLCRLKYALTYESRDRYGFAEPSIFGNETNQCSILNPDSRRCELPACEKTLKKEYGCATATATTKSSSSSSSSSCDMMMPFQTTLLQTRQPWAIVRSLVYKYCWRSTTSSSSSSNKNNIEVGPVQDNMPSSLSSLFEVLGLIPPTPDNNDDNDKERNENDKNNHSHNHHCVNQFIDYVSGYYNTILDNSNANNNYDYDTTETKTKTTTGLKSGITMYKIEDASPCDVAKMAGLYDPITTVYKPNHDIVANKCNNKDNDKDAEVTKKDETKKIISVKRDLIPYTTPEHITKMKELFIRLNYEYNEE